MQISKVIDKFPFGGHKKQQREIFWDLAQDQTRFLYNVAFKYVGNRYDAEDLVQETLYTAFHNFHQLRDRKKFKSWVFTILRNHFLRDERKKKPAHLVEFEDGIDFLSQVESVSLQQDAASVYERKVEAVTIQSLLDQLPEKYKVVLILYYMEESTYQDIADMLKVPIGTVMSRLSRGKQFMKKALLRSSFNETQAHKVVRLNIKR